MAINRRLGIALAISFFWHISWLGIVSVVFLPDDLEVKQYATVNFMGSILIKAAYLEPELPSGELLALPIQMRNAVANSFSGSPDSAFSSGRKIFKPDKFIDIDERKQELSFLTDDLTETVSEREIIFQPPRPEHLLWARQEFSASTAVFKIYITERGLVQEVINMQASGSPELDVALAGYIRKWRFAPVEEKQLQCQIVKVDIE